MIAHDFAIHSSDFFRRSEILLFVDDIPHHPSDVFGLGFRFCEHFYNVFQRLTRLGHEIVRDDFARGVPANHAAYENHLSLRGYSVRVSARTSPTRWLQDFHICDSSDSYRRRDSPLHGTTDSAVQMSALLERLNYPARDDQLLHFSGAFVNAERANFAIEPLDRLFADYALSPKHLDDCIDHA